MRKGTRKLEIFNIPNHGDIDIRFGSAGSIFSAELFGKTFSNQDINKLKAELLEEAASREKTTWKPVILIDTDSWHWDRNASGIQIEKRYLGTTTYPDNTQKQHLACVHTEMHKDDLDIQNWKPCNPQEEWKGDTEGKKLIDYTKERYETLKFLQIKMGEFKKRIRDVIRSAKGAEFVDALAAHKNLFLQDDFSKKMLSAPEEAQEATQCSR